MIREPFGDLRIGHVTTSAGRTITETDLVQFCMLTGNWLGLHCDVEYAKTTRYGQRVAQGSLVFSLANAMIPFDPEVVEAFYGVDKLRFHKPTFIGDTLHARAEIVELRERDDGSGIATSLLQAVKQDGEVAMSCRFSLLIRRERLKAGA
jgi:acyl dehydratase